jgi:hypothetical protein
MGVESSVIRPKIDHVTTVREDTHRWYASMPAGQRYLCNHGNAGDVLTRLRKTRFRQTIVEPKEEPELEENEDTNTSAVESCNQSATSNLFLDVPLHGGYQTRHVSPASSVSGLVPARTPYSRGSTFQIPIVGEYSSQFEEDKPHVDARSPYFPYPEDCQNSYFGIMMSYQLGSTPTEPLNSLPIEATRRNAELMHMCESFYTSCPKEDC